MVRATLYMGSLAVLASAALGKSYNVLGVEEAEEYRSGAKHDQIMKIKMAKWQEELNAGLMNSALYPELGYTKCINGFAAAIPGDKNNTFKCSNMDLYHFLSHADLGSSRQGQASSSWGWTDPASDREFVLIGHFDGTAFAEITSEGKLSYLGRLPTWDAFGGAQWREIRVIEKQALLVVGSEAFAHGVQFFDLKKLLTLDPENPTTFTQDDLASHWGMDPRDPAKPWGTLPVGRTHNIVVNQDGGYAMAVGSVGGNVTTRVRENMPCNGGIIFLNTTDIYNVQSTGCAAGDYYVHDAECLTYHGPDKRYEGRDICYGYNEDTITIYDVTNKVGNTTTIISRTTYEGAQYIHQGSVLDRKNQEYLVMDDEFDEQRRSGVASNRLPTTHIFDIKDLENPKWVGFYQGRRRSIDHNQYVIDSLVYQSNYGAGFSVLDLKSVPKDPSGEGVCEVGFFDIYPEDDELPGGGTDTFVGTWSSYAYFKSGFIYINTIERGSFVVKLTSKSCPKAPICNADNCLRALRANTIPGRLEESQEFCASYTARQRTEVADVTKAYATAACTREIPGGVVAQVSSACACLPTTTPRPEAVF